MSTKLLRRMLESGIDGMREEWELEKHRRKKSTKTLQTKKDMVQEFWDTIYETLKVCKILSYYPEYEEIWILFPTYDDEIITIGMLDEENDRYLLDSNFIFNRFRFRNLRSNICCNLDYSELFRLGILEPYEHSYKEPLVRLKLENSYKTYFCLPTSLVDFDIHTLHWI